MLVIVRFKAIYPSHNPIESEYRNNAKPRHQLELARGVITTYWSCNVNDRISPVHS